MGLCVFLLGVVRVMGVVSCFCGWLVRGSPGRVLCVFFYSGLAGSCVRQGGGSVAGRLSVRGVMKGSESFEVKRGAKKERYDRWIGWS